MSELRKALVQAAKLIESEYCSHDGPHAADNPTCYADFIYAALSRPEVGELPIVRHQRCLKQCALAVETVKETIEHAAPARVADGVAAIPSADEVTAKEQSCVAPFKEPQ